MLKIYKMKKIAIIIFSIFGLTAYSQDVYEIMAKETCDCITKKNIDLDKSSSQVIQAQLGGCMLTSYSAHKNEMKPEDRVEYGDSEGMRKLGENVALKMLNSCPDIIMKLGNQYIDKKSKGDIIIDNNIIKGQFLESKSNDFLTITVKDSSGRIYSFVLLTFFENSNLITDNLLKKDQKVEVEYVEQEFYDVKSKDFRLYKVLKGIKKL